jgi:hypothetical protein
MQPTPIMYDDDTRYPGPEVHPPPEYITGIPTQGELDAQARMFTWGELKEIISKSTRESRARSRQVYEASISLPLRIETASI